MKIDGNGIFFLIFVPIVVVVVVIGYGYKTAIAMSIFFGGLYSYYFMFLNVIYSIKERDLTVYRNKIAVRIVTSLLIFVFSCKFYGLSFALKPLIVILVISGAQSIIVLRK